MAVGRISGPLLKQNLLRNGVNLAFENDLLYLDVVKQRIGIKTDTPTHELQINGTTRTTDLIVDNRADIAGVFFENNRIGSTGPVLNLGTVDNVVALNKIRIDSIAVEGNTISTVDSNANLEINPNGSGTVEVLADMNVTGNIHATGNISADGNITLGDANTDNITFSGEINSNIIPDITDTYQLGSDPAEGGKRWNDLWVTNIFASSVNTQDLDVEGIDLTLKHGNIWYVSQNGDDSRFGDHIQDPYRSIAQALLSAQNGDTVYIFPGLYEEVFPLTVPTGVTVKGQSLRSVIITPTVATQNNDAFLLNGESTVEDITIKDFFTGYAFKFAPGFTVTTRSPYIKNVSVITQGSTVTVDDPRGFLAGDAGKGAFVDGSIATALSNEASMLFHSVTFITPGVDALVATNGARIEWLNCFTYFANRGLYAFDSNDGLYGAGKTRIRLGGVSGTFAAGDTVTFDVQDSTDVSLLVESVNGDILIIDGKNTDLLGFDTTPTSISNGTGATASSIENIDLQDFGAEIRMISSANVYGNYGLYGDGPGVIVYAIGQNLAYIGVGKESSNDPNAVIQANEVVELNSAKIRYNSVDHKGDFRVGDLFYVDQDTGNASFNVNEFNIDTSNGVNITSNGNTTFINGDRIDTGNLRFSGNTVESLSGDINLNAASNLITLDSNVNVTGNLDVTGNITLGGNLQIGDEATDTVQIVAGIDSNLIPNLDTAYDLGDPTKVWNNLYINTIELGNIQIQNNVIQTTESNSDLELRANGTGTVSVPTNDTLIQGSLTVLGNSTFSDITVNADIIQTGNTTQTGNYIITGQLTNGDIQIDGNTIETTLSNSNLELRANGSGRITVPNNDVIITNNLTINGLTFLSDTSISGTLTHTGNTTQIGNYTITGEFNNGNILINNNLIETTDSNSNLELRASGTGLINVPANNVTFSQNLTVDGTTNLSNTEITGTITHTGDVVHTGVFNIAGEITNGNILIEDNFISTTVSNSDLELRANGIGDILVPSNNLIIENNLNVNGVTTLNDVNLVGTLTHTGNSVQTGNYTVNGTSTVTGNLTVTQNAQFEEILIDDNYITTTTSNADLELRANGTGVVLIPNNDLVIANDLNIQGTANFVGINVTGTFTAASLSDGDILILGNKIQTTLSNSNLEFVTNGNGVVNLNSGLETTADITTTGDTTLNDVTINGTVSHTGNITQTGNIALTGNASISGTLDVGGDVQLENIQIIDNIIQTTQSNSDLELRASGTGQVIIPANDLTVTGDLDIGGTLSLLSLNVNSTITSPTFDTGDITISSNVITTNLSNSDLELRANGTGIVNVTTADLLIDQNLDVLGTTTLSTTVVNGGLTVSGNITQTGNINLTGNMTVSGPVNIAGDTQLENIKITGNTITTTDSNSDLELRANGTGNVVIPNNDVEINNNLIINGDLFANDLTNLGVVSANSYSTGDILIDDNYITTTLSNSDLELRANGTGSIVIEQLSFNDYTISSSTDIILEPASGYLKVNGTGAIKLPLGTTLDRPTGVAGQIRYNSDLQRFEGFNGTNWITLQGVEDLDGDTRVTAELTEGANDDTIRFYAGGNLVADVNQTRFRADKLVLTDIEVDGTTIQTTTTNTDLTLSGNGTGSVQVENFKFNGNTITNTVADAVTTFENTGNGYVKIPGSGGVVIPSGNNIERPFPPYAETGMIRYNNQDGRVELFEGTSWVSIAGTSSGISTIDAENLAIEYVIVLG